MKIENLKPGMTVYDVHSHRMGHTTIRTVEVWDVEIIAVDVARGIVLAKWNDNPPQEYSISVWSRWRAKEPKLIDAGFPGQQRLARRGEAP